MIKKTISFVLAITILFTITIPCFATNEIDAVLLERGYPSDVLARMTPEQKLELYQDENLTYVGTLSINYTEDFPKDFNNSLQPYGQISTSDLSLYFDVSCAMNGGTSNTLNYIYIQFHYNWNKIPVMRFQDPIAISWDDTKFRLEDDSFSKVDKFTGYFTDFDGTAYWLHDEIHSSESGYAEASTAGVSWYADLKGNIGIVVTELYGYGSFKLVPAHGVTIYDGLRSTLYAHYVHPTLSFGASIAVKTYGSFDVSGGGSYDERGTQRTITITDAAG